MRRCSSILMALVLMSTGTYAQNETFEQAREAYDGGLYDEASELYQSMVDRGIDNVEVYYNLANALFRSGDLPQAVARYRTAWYKSPRDPDINANLRFALHAAGAVEPAPSLLERSFTSLSAEEWIRGAVGAYLLLCLLLLLALRARRKRALWLKLGLIPAGLLLIAAGGWWQWHRLTLRPEAVITAPSGATALFAPLADSKAHIRIPAGALVRRQARDPKGWVEIEYDGKTGWVKTDQLKYVYP